MISIRKAKETDYLEIARLDRIVWKKYPNSRYIPDGEHVWLHWIEGAIVICASLDDTIVGTACAFPYINHKFCVHKIFVHKKYRNRKIGTNMLKRLVKEIDMYNQDAFLTVHPGKKAAIKLYESLGFTEKKFVKSYYREDEDRYILTRKSRKKKLKKIKKKIKSDSLTKVLSIRS